MFSSDFKEFTVSTHAKSRNNRPQCGGTNKNKFNALEQQKKALVEGSKTRMHEQTLRASMHYILDYNNPPHIQEPKSEILKICVTKNYSPLYFSALVLLQIRKKVSYKSQKKCTKHTKSLMPIILHCNDCMLCSWRA